MITAQVRALITCSTLLKYICGFLLMSHSASLPARIIFVSAKSNDPPLALRWSIMFLGVWFRKPGVLSSISIR